MSQGGPSATATQTASKPGQEVLTACKMRNKETYSKQSFPSPLPIMGSTGQPFKTEVSLDVPPPLPAPDVPGKVWRSLKKSPPKPDLKAPDVVNGCGCIELTWEPRLEPLNAHIKLYQVYQFVAPGEHWTKVTEVGAGSATTITLMQVKPGRKYNFAVRGVDIFNSTGPFAVKAVTTNAL